MKIENKKIILLHPGKTGGTSLEHTLRDTYLPDKKLIAKVADRDIMFGLDKEYRIYLQHADLRLYKILDIPFDKYQTITTVRRPYERILSCYYYNGKSKKHTFEEFVTHHLEEHRNVNMRKRFSVSHFSPQHFYTNLDSYKVDHVLRQENLNDEAKDIGIKVKYKHSKTISTKNINPMDMYNNKTKDIVYNLYKEDFELFGYEK